MIRDKHKGKSKGYGFVSFLDPFEGLKGAYTWPPPPTAHRRPRRSFPKSKKQQQHIWPLSVPLTHALSTHPAPPSHFIHTTALREMNLKYIGSRPVKLRKSDWKDRNLKEVKKKEKEKQKFLTKLGLS